MLTDILETPPDLTEFGLSVSADKNRFAVGGVQRNSASGNAVGAVVIYDAP
jgi:hypothetical protein